MTAAEPKESHVHAVAVLALDQVIPFDLSTPLEIFGRVRLPGGRYPYNVGVCAPAPDVGSRGFAIRAAWGLDVLEILGPARDRSSRSPARPVPGSCRAEPEAAREQVVPGRETA